MTQVLEIAWSFCFLIVERFFFFFIYFKNAESFYKTKYGTVKTLLLRWGNGTQLKFENKRNYFWASRKQKYELFSGLGKHGNQAPTGQKKLSHVFLVPLVIRCTLLHQSNIHIFCFFFFFFQTRVYLCQISEWELSIQ